jgi:hypothetical protein
MKSYSFEIETHKSPKEVYGLLLEIKKWWSGIYDETISGKSKKEQELTELIPYKKIVWEVIESNLSFLDNPKEWEKTKLQFDISEKENKTKITFTHAGLVPHIECFEQCSNAWTQYLFNLNKQLK